MDDVDELTLHTGLTVKDLAKPLYTYYTEAEFRNRHFSYLTEMLSFKFWQALDIGFFRNYTLILLHIFNCFLLGLLIYYLFKDRRAALAASLLFLNAGSSISTLLFPFRNAKILVMTFFLISWIMIVCSQKKFYLSSFAKLTAFFFIFLCALFTDEVALFLYPILLMYIVIRDGKEGVLNKRFLMGLSISVLISVALTYVFYQFSMNSVPYVHNQVYVKMFHSLLGYWAKPLMACADIFKGFFFYFLRFNLGSWRFSALGILSFISTLFLFVFMFSQRKPKEFKLFLFTVLGFLFIKACLLPHNAGVHPVLMPENAFFPTLLYFRYYYIYPETLMMVLVMMMMIHFSLRNQRRFVLVLAFITIISFSNAYYYYDGIKFALTFHEWDRSENQQAIKKITFINKILKNKDYLPVYLSFQSGDQKLIKERLHDPKPNIYGRFIPLKYIKQIQEGRAIVSVENISNVEPFEYEHELQNAKFFYDVKRSEFYNMLKLRNTVGMEHLKPMQVKGKIMVAKTQLDIPEGTDYLILFVKGKARLSLENKEHLIKDKQTYGYSYQMFKYDQDDFKGQFPKQIQFVLRPDRGNDLVEVVGPFMIKK